MKRVFTALCLSALTLPFIGAAPAPAPAAAPASVPDFAKKLPEFKSGEPVLTFNGKNLDGWYTYLHDNKYEDPNKVFSVKDGMLHISGQEWGGITSKNNYSNYHLVTEWKWGGKTWAPRETKSRDSGILVHGTGKDGAYGKQWLEAIEVQIIEGGTGDFIVVAADNPPSLTCETRIGPDQQFYFHPGGEAVTKRTGRFNWWGRDVDWKDVLGVRGPLDVERPVGEWNRLEIICDGDTVSTILNGYLVNVGTKSLHSEGKIQVQSEGAEIIFRKIEVRPLVKK